MQVQVDPNPLTNLKEKARAHWRTYRPQMAENLEEMGQLEEALEAAVEMTTEAVWQMRTATGCSITEAWMEVREMYVILPAESDEVEAERDEVINPVGWIGIVAGMEEDE